MLLYHPATDFYHCWMRIAAIVIDCDTHAVEYDRLRILDYLLCFPREIAKVELPATGLQLRTLVRRLPEQYEATASIRQVFGPMGRVQMQVVRDMVGRGLISREKYLEGAVAPAPGADMLKVVADHWRARRQDWYSTALQVFCGLPLKGDGGLKARTGLLEFRYD